MVVEGAGARALEARERVARGRSDLRGVSGGGLGADRVDMGGAHDLSLGTAGARRSRGETGRTPPAHPLGPRSPPDPGSAFRPRDARLVVRHGLAAAAKRCNRYSQPRSANDTTSPSPTTKWSMRRTSTRASASRSRPVMARSARLGSATPEGWL